MYKVYRRDNALSENACSSAWENSSSGLLVEHASDNFQLVQSVKIFFLGNFNLLYTFSAFLWCQYYLVIPPMIHSGLLLRFINVLCKRVQTTNTFILPALSSELVTLQAQIPSGLVFSSFLFIFQSSSEDDSLFPTFSCH